MGAGWARRRPGTRLLREGVQGRAPRLSAGLGARLNCLRRSVSKGVGCLRARAPGSCPGFLARRLASAGGAKPISRGLLEVPAPIPRGDGAPQRIRVPCRSGTAGLTWNPLMAGKGQGTAGQGGRRSHRSGFQLRMSLSGSVSHRSRRSGSVGVAACSLIGRLE